MNESPEKHKLYHFLHNYLLIQVCLIFATWYKSSSRKTSEKGDNTGDKGKQYTEKLTPPTDVIYNFNMVNASEDLEEFVGKLIKSEIKTMPSYYMEKVVVVKVN